MVRSTPRWGRIQVGAAIAVAGLALLALGGAIFGGQDVLAVAKPAARAPLPGEARFEARKGRYAILLNRVNLTGPPSAVVVAATTCSVRRSDETTVELRGARQASRTESDVAVSIGGFAATSGPTRVRCTRSDTTRRSGLFVVARRTRRATVLIWVLTGAGLVALLLGAGLLAHALRNPLITWEPAQ